MRLFLPSLQFNSNLFVCQPFSIDFQVIISPFLETSQLDYGIFGLHLNLLLLFLHFLKTLDVHVYTVVIRLEDLLILLIVCLFHVGFHPELVILVLNIDKFRFKIFNFILTRLDLFLL
jgi:hypothetical protein